MENRLRFLLGLYPQTVLKLSSETQVAFLPRNNSYFNFSLFFPEVLIVVYFDSSLFVHFESKVSLLIFPELLKVVHSDTLLLQVKHF